MGDGIQVTLGGDWRGFSEMLKKADAATVSWGKGFIDNIKGTMGAAFGAAALEEWVRGSIRAAARINDLADQFQITRQEVQMLDKVTMDTGQTMDDFGGILIRLAAARKAAALDPSGKEASAFAMFGVGQSQLTNPNIQNSAQLLEIISKNMQGMKITPEVVAAFAEIGGKSGPKLLAAIKQINEVSKGGSLFYFDDKTLDDLEQVENSLNKIGKLLQKMPAVSLTMWKQVGDNWNPIKWAKGGIDRLRGIKPAPEPGDPDFIGPEEEDPALKNMRERRKLYAAERQKQWDEKVAKAATAQADVEGKIGDALMSSMTPEQKKQALSDKYNDLINNAMRAQFFDADPEASQKMFGEAAGVANQMGGLQMSKAWSWAPKLSQNQAIGAYSAATSASNPAVTAQKEATAMLKQLVELSREQLKIARDEKFQ